MGRWCHFPHSLTYKDKKKSFRRCAFWRCTFWTTSHLLCLRNVTPVKNIPSYAHWRPFIPKCIHCFIIVMALYLTISNILVAFILCMNLYSLAVYILTYSSLNYYKYSSSVYWWELLQIILIDSWWTICLLVEMLLLFLLESVAQAPMDVILDTHSPFMPSPMWGHSTT